MTTKRPADVENPFATRLKEAALRYPETTEEFPWGERALKVRGKVFLFMHASVEGLSLSVKLPTSQALALELPFTQPTGYGLGKSGWTSAKFGPKDKPPMDALLAWLDESYRAVAPKKLVATLPAGTRASNSQQQKKKPVKRAAKKPASKKAKRAPARAKARIVRLSRA
jgi:predicted DNA-binding protein (MmcQ/YjbR family)